MQQALSQSITEAFRTSQEHSATILKATLAGINLGSEKIDNQVPEADK